MSHKIIDSVVHQYRKAPAATIISRASSMQQSIRDVLGSDYETFLQGSYKNDTAISDFNDVDIVAIRKTTHSGTFAHIEVSSRVSWDAIFSEIEAKLDASPLYRGKHSRGDKCITVEGTVNIDIVPAVKVTTELEDPIAVYSFREGMERLNHPRLHFENGKLKNANTNGHYKPIVRIMKSWAYQHFDDPKIAPSFYVECIVHSVPDRLFTSDHAGSFIDIGIDMLKKLANPHIPVYTVSGSRNIFDDWSPENREQFRKKFLDTTTLFLNALNATSELEASRHWHRGFNQNV